MMAITEVNKLSRYVGSLKTTDVRHSPCQKGEAEVTSLSHHTLNYQRQINCTDTGYGFVPSAPVYGTENFSNHSMVYVQQPLVKKEGK